MGLGLVRVLVIVCSLATLLRLLAALHPHSGHNTPPMFGDFEAQRHWIEITNALPPPQWYHHNLTAHNDLEYWGLDYPPITAFHSLAMGKAARFFLSLVFGTATNGKAEAEFQRMFGLVASRGQEDTSTVVFMRLSALLSDWIFFFPPFLLLVVSLVRRIVNPTHMLSLRCHSNATIRNQLVTPKSAASSSSSSSKALTKKLLQDASASAVGVYCFVGLTLLCAPLIFVDHGHFQYNAVSLGLMLCGMWLTMDLSSFSSFSDDDSYDDEKIATGQEEQQGKKKSATSTSTVVVILRCLGLILCTMSSLLFKQMSLYYAPAVGVFLLGHAWRISKARRPLAFVATCVLFAFVGLGYGALWFVLPFHNDVGQVLHRMFPFKRGLYEDKVASVWCSVSPVWKLTNFWASSGSKKQDRILQSCTASTVLAFSVGCLRLLRSIAAKQKRASSLLVLPTDGHSSSSTTTSSFSGGPGLAHYRYFRGSGVCQLALGMFVSSSSFFLFSFQVHEKSILLPWMPSCVLALGFLMTAVSCDKLSALGGEGGGAGDDDTQNQQQQQRYHLSFSLKRELGAAKECAILFFHFSLIALFSMYPLAVKDKNQTLYAGLFSMLAVGEVLMLRLFSLPQQRQHHHQREREQEKRSISSRSDKKKNNKTTDAEQPQLVADVPSIVGISSISKFACCIIPASLNRRLAAAAPGTLPSSSAAATFATASIAGMLMLHTVNCLLVPPSRYPDIVPLLFCSYSCVHFVLYLLWVTRLLGVTH